MATYLSPAQRYLFLPLDIRSKLDEKRSIKIEIIQTINSDKKLLVLDLDFTLWDGNAQTEELHMKLRPGLTEFLLKVKEYYNIIIWSNCPYNILMCKLRNLGLLDPKFGVIAVMDRSFIFTIKKTSLSGRMHDIPVKALDIIWYQLEQFNPHNTVHVDDIKNNFLLNRNEGILIKPFKFESQNDCELQYLGDYLVRLAGSTDFCTQYHDQWRETK